MKFKVRIGYHHQGGKKYGPGETVESDRDLTKTFPGKFSASDAEEAEAGGVAVDEPIAVSPAELVARPEPEGVPAPAPNKPGRRGAFKSAAPKEVSSAGGLE